jgi:16S rRNA (guanine527-N7)-methyltransferase
MVESITKKCAFLQAVVGDLGLPAEVHCQRVESFIPAFPNKPDVVTARALAPLPKLLEMTFPLLKRGALGLFLKGQDVGSELTEAAKCWNIGCQLVPSRTDERGRIIVIESLESRKPAAKAGRPGRQTWKMP